MKLGIIYLAAIFTVLHLSGCSQPEVPAGALLNQAAAKASEGNWAGADALAKQVLKQDKHNVNALMLRALARNNLDARSEAAEYAIHAARVRPDLFLAQYIQGMLLSRNGKPELALKALREARRLRPDDVNTLILLAENSLAVRRYEDAAGYFKLLARHPGYRNSSYLWNGLGICHTVLNPKLAMKFFRVAQRNAPNDPVTALNVAVVYDRYLKDRARAAAGYERFIRLATGKAEYDTIRQQAEYRLDSMKGR